MESTTISVCTIRGEEMYRRALRADQAYLVKIKSAQRDAAAAAREDCPTFSVCTFMGRLLIA